MKRLVAPKDPKEVAAAFSLKDLVPGWYFRVREISAGQFVAEGTDLYGRMVSHQGEDQQAVLVQCVSVADGFVARAGNAGDAA